MEQPDKTPILRTQGISKKFGAVLALQDVDFEVYSGEVVGLVGDNGAGKSTLVKVISGVHEADSGDIFFEGRQVKITKPRDSTDLGIETVYQDLALCDNLDVVGNLFIGRESTSVAMPGSKGLSWLDETAMEKRAIGLLKELHVPIPSVKECHRQHVRRTATIRRSRQIGHVEQQGRDTGRTYCSAWRRTDPSGGKPDFEIEGAQPGGGGHQP